MLGSYIISSQSLSSQAVLASPEAEGPFSPYTLHSCCQSSPMAPELESQSGFLIKHYCFPPFSENYLSTPPGVND